MKKLKSTLVILLGVPLALVADPKQLVDVQVYPKEANIFTKRGKQSLVVQAKCS